nr:hypothetical protein [uncultured Albidiferax sp.]
MDMRVGSGRHKLVGGLTLLVGWGLAAAAWGVPIADQPSSAFQSQPAAEAPTVDVDALTATADTPAKSTAPKSADAPARSGSPELPMPRVEPASTSGLAEPESLRSSLKELANSSGVVDALHTLNSELNGSASGTFADAPDGGADMARRTEAQPGSEARMGVRAAPLTEEQRKLEEAQASFLFSALVQEVTPWLIAAALMYVVIYGARVMLAYSRMKAARKRKRRESKSGARTRSARID